MINVAHVGSNLSSVPSNKSVSDPELIPGTTKIHAYFIIIIIIISFLTYSKQVATYKLKVLVLKYQTYKKID